MAGKAGDAFTNIRQSIVGVSEQANEVSAVVQQASAGMNAMAETISAMTTESGKTAANAQHIAAAAEEQNASMEEIAAASSMLAKLAEELLESVNQFKV